MEKSQSYAETLLTIDNTGVIVALKMPCLVYAIRDVQDIKRHQKVWINGTKQSENGTLLHCIEGKAYEYSAFRFIDDLFQVLNRHMNLSPKSPYPGDNNP